MAWLQICQLILARDTSHHNKTDKKSYLVYSLLISSSISSINMSIIIYVDSNRRWKSILYLSHNINLSHNGSLYTVYDIRYIKNFNRYVTLLFAEDVSVILNSHLSEKHIVTHHWWFINPLEIKYHWRRGDKSNYLRSGSNKTTVSDSWGKGKVGLDCLNSS